MGKPNIRGRYVLLPSVSLGRTDHYSSFTIFLRRCHYDISCCLSAYIPFCPAQRRTLICRPHSAFYFPRIFWCQVPSVYLVRISPRYSHLEPLQKNSLLPNTSLVYSFIFSLGKHSRRICYRFYDLRFFILLRYY